MKRKSISPKTIFSKIQNQFNEASCIYEILYVIDLYGGSLVIPDNCTLDFKGGSFINYGSIELSNTYIIGTNKIFDCSGNIIGTIKNTSLNVILFGAKGDGITNDTVAIQKTYDLCSNSFTTSEYRVIMLLNSEKYLCDTLNFHNGIDVNGNNCQILANTNNQTIIDFYSPNILDNRLNKHTIRDIIVNSNGYVDCIGFDCYGQYGGINFTLHNCYANGTSDKKLKYGFYIHGSQYYILNNTGARFSKVGYRIKSSITSEHGGGNNILMNAPIATVCDISYMFGTKTITNQPNNCVILNQATSLVANHCDFYVASYQGLYISGANPENPEISNGILQPFGQVITVDDDIVRAELYI